MRSAFGLASLAVFWGLWLCIFGLAIPNVMDNMLRSTADADVSLKTYLAFHTPENRGILEGEKAKLINASTVLDKADLVNGPLTMLRRSLRPVVTELVNEIDGALGITVGRYLNKFRKPKKAKVQATSKQKGKDNGQQIPADQI